MKTKSTLNLKGQTESLGFIKKIFFVSLFLVLAIPQIANSQTYHIFAQTELLLNGDRFPNDSTYVIRIFAKKASNSSSQNNTRFVTDFQIDFSYDTVDLEKMEYYLILNGEEILKGQSYNSTSQGNYSISANVFRNLPARNTINSTKYSEHVRYQVNVNSTNTGNDTTGLIKVSDLSTVGTEMFRIYTRIKNPNPQSLACIYCTPSALNYLADTTNAHLVGNTNDWDIVWPGEAPSNPSPSPWFIWPYSDIDAPEWKLLNGSGTVINNWKYGGFAAGFLIPLPVNYAEIKATPTPNSVLVSWITTAEVNNNGFEIQKSNNGEFWQSIAFVEGNGTSFQLNSYAFEDLKPFPGINMYRIKQIDWNGNFAISDAKSVIWNQNDNSTRISVFPNPATSEIQIMGNNIVKINLMTSSGKLISSHKEQNTISIANLNQGLYFLHIEDSYGKTSIHNFIKQ
jgi:hypothetical protein